MTNKEFKGFGKEPDRSPLPSNKTLEKWCEQANEGDVSAQMKIGNWWNTLTNSFADMESSTFIKESAYEPIDCCLCGAHMPSINDTHNPFPLTQNCTAKMALEENLPHRCCSKCASEKVLPARMGSHYDQFTKDTFYKNLGY